MSQRPTTGFRPRYGRVAAVGASAAMTAVAVLGGTGVLGDGHGRTSADTVHTVAAELPADVPVGGAAAHADGGAVPADAVGTASIPSGPAGAPGAARPTLAPVVDPPVPADSGHGRRIVFDQSDQRVWLVAADDSVERSYLVSGSVSDNLHPGVYTVYSRSQQAYGIDDSGTMQYFVRFTRGENAAIGFHDIPVQHGHLIQTRAQLGTPRSHGCIRQWRPDAIALWRFAPIGTAVVVTA